MDFLSIPNNKSQCYSARERQKASYRMENDLRNIKQQKDAVVRDLVEAFHIITYSLQIVHGTWIKIRASYLAK